MSVTTVEPIVKTITVGRSSADAFRLFTEEITAWWPLATHTRARDAAGERTVRVEIEPRVGGRVYETLDTGEEREWGEVLAHEPPSRLVFSFGMGRPREQSGEVEVRFEAADGGACRVTLTHAHWERMGEEAATLRGRFATGWDAVFVDGFGRHAGAN